MPSNERSTSYWILLVIAGVALMQLTSKPSGTKLRPGRERDDVFLNRETLPPSIENWQRLHFHPPEEAGMLFKEQYWITHAWAFGNGEHVSTVAFDQLGLHEWHELTVCYEARGWEVLNRSIEVDTNTEDPWSFAFAIMSNPQGEYGLLVFSVFRGDGQPITPPEIGLDHTDLAQESSGFWDRLQNRTQSRVPPKVRLGLENRALQCQVFLVTPRSPDDQLVLQTKQLHLESRLRFRDAWLAHATLTLAK